jgi:3-hydroxyacyl-CoA dehydrogenase
MELGKRLEHVTVLGAAGKMGCGIASLLAVELTKRRLAFKAPDSLFRLNLMDVSEDGLRALAEYLRGQALKAAERSAAELRRLYAHRADLVENGEMIDEFVRDVLRTATFTTDLASARSSHMVFEAIVENEDVKLSVYRRLREVCSPETYFFTNTSSIPIRLLDDSAGLDGRIIGYHFYNPPPVQKLVELITSPPTRPDLVEQAKELGKALRKTLIVANDVAGFIGNGHFIRDGLHAIAEVLRLERSGFSQAEAIYAINRVSQDWMVRPMGIFQLIDYVGIDVFQLILRVMDRYLPKAALHSDLIDQYVGENVKGGQFASGAQKDGFFKYEKTGIGAVYDLKRRGYLALEFGEAGWSGKVDAQLGATPVGCQPWKKWMGQPNRDTTLLPYLDSLWQSETLGARLARSYLLRSADIAQTLVSDGVAGTAEDVNGVLLYGFFHAYGPVNEVTRRRLVEHKASENKGVQS